MDVIKEFGVLESQVALDGHMMLGPDNESKLCANLEAIRVGEITHGTAIT